jgi:hypothetical protein
MEDWKFVDFKAFDDYQLFVEAKLGLEELTFSLNEVTRVLTYLALLATELGLNLSDIAKQSLEELYEESNDSEEHIQEE